MRSLAILRGGLLLGGFLLAAGGVAEARIPLSSPVTADTINLAPGNLAPGPNAMNEVQNMLPAAPSQDTALETKTITFNFGPLHFQEVVKAAPKSCRS